MIRLFIIITILLTTSPLFAQDSSAPVDWDKIDNRLFVTLKQEKGLSDAETYELIGRTHAQQNIPDRAVINFGKALGIDPNRYLSWYYLGLLTMDNPEECFKRAIKARPDFPDSYYWLASYYCKNKNPKESIRYFEEYLAVVKSSPDEAGRIKTANGFIEEMKRGETDYNVIASNIITKK